MTQYRTYSTDTTDAWVTRIEERSWLRSVQEQATYWIMQHGNSLDPSKIPLFRHQSCYFRPLVVVKSGSQNSRIWGQRRSVEDIRSGAFGLGYHHQLPRQPNQDCHQHVPRPLRPTLVTLTSQQRRHTRTSLLPRSEHKHTCVFSPGI